MRLHRKGINGGPGMEYFERLEQEVSLWPDISINAHRFEAGSSVSRLRKSVTSILAESSTFLFHVRFVMRFWQRVLQRSTVGSRIQAGSPFKSAAKGTSSMPYG